MTRRTLNLSVDITVDEDAMRLREDDDPQAWSDTINVIRTALHTIAHDNLPDDAVVVVRKRRVGIDYLS